MVWGAISWSGSVSIVFLEGRQTGTHYRNLLESQVPIFNGMFGHGNWIYQHDNAPIHTARVVQQYLNEENIEVLSWPALSPDLNIIENAWGYLSRKIYEKGQQYNDKTDLKAAILHQWDSMPLNYIQELYKFIPRRLLATVETRGGHIKY